MAGNQGEGDKESARRYNEDQKEFVDSGKVEQKRDERANLSEQERQELERAEDIGKSHSKE